MSSLALGLCFQGYAKEELMSLTDLMDIKLSTGSFLELDMMNSSVSMTVIEKDQVDKSGARHLSELLEIYVPGFQYMYNKWNGTIWGMRGVAADRNTKFIFLINGHKMNHESRDGAVGEQALGMLGDIERVEVLRGPSGLVYGSGAIAGVINIVTKKSEDEDKTTVIAHLGTWSGATTSKQFEANIFSDLPADQKIMLNLGYKESEGVGDERARIMGRAHWPFAQWRDDSPENGVPSAGSAWSTPGNWKMGLSWEWEEFSLYSRFTHQVENAGGIFNVDPWPEVMGGVTVDGSEEVELASGSDIPEGGTFIRSYTANVETANEAGDSITISTEDRDVYSVPTKGNTTRKTALVDGKQRTPDSFYGDSESWNNNRRQYIVDNLFAELKYKHAFESENEVQLKASVDAVTNTIQREERKGFESAATDERNTFIEETFGEKRFSLGAMYLLKNIPNLQLATGYEFRYDMAGDDMSGKNSQAEKGSHAIISEIEYTNHAIFLEGIYDLSEEMALHAGARYDAHTRTIDQGGILSPKFAFILKPNENHSVKFIYQTSANNGSVDNYEYNRNNFDDEGTSFSDYHFEKRFEEPGNNSPVIAGVTEEDLHKLKPEKVQSFELNSVHKLTDGLTILPSVSYNKVSDLFTWSQPDFRIINAGSYEFINLEFESKYKTKYFDLGMAHTRQQVVGMDVAKQSKTLVGPDFDKNGDYYDVLTDEFGRTYYIPKSTGTASKEINPIMDQITVDGENFLNLATDVSKIYADIKILNGFTFHADARLFWGLKGRTDIHEYTATSMQGDIDEIKETTIINVDSSVTTRADTSYNTVWKYTGDNEDLNNDNYNSTFKDNDQFSYWGIHEDVMTKLNLSLHWQSEDGLKVSAYVYDVLASQEGGNTIHSLRWQQSGNSKEHTDLFSMDLTSYAIRVEKNF